MNSSGPHPLISSKTVTPRRRTAWGDQKGFKAHQEYRYQQRHPFQTRDDPAGSRRNPTAPCFWQPLKLNVEARPHTLRMNYVVAFTINFSTETAPWYEETQVLRRSSMGNVALP
jgi:hypothetical protein